MRIATKRSKYGAKATVIDGIRFASQREAKRYAELKLLEKAGEVNRILCQPIFELSVIDMSVAGRLKRAAAHLGGKDVLEATPPQKIGRYVADFSYWTKDDKYVVEDVKAPPTKTPIYRWKVKHLRAQYGIDVKEI